jgi:hypothetical protein
MDFNLPANPAEAGISFIATSTTAPTLYILPLFE